jgi:hypothetical protein
MFIFPSGSIDSIHHWAWQWLEAGQKKPKKQTGAGKCIPIF